MKKVLLLVVFLISSLILTSQSYAAGERPFTATVFQFDPGMQPSTLTKRYESKIKSITNGMVKITEITSFINGKSEADVVIKIVTSNNNSAAVMMYNAKGDVLAELPSWEIVDRNLYVFKGGDDKHKVSAKWFIEADSLLSEYSITDEKGVQVYWETVVYTAKNPSQK
jgi:hypothetical protein